MNCPPHAVLAILLLLPVGFAPEVRAQRTIDLSGTWRFTLDRGDRGIPEHWWMQRFPETVRLPGSTAENGKGDDVTVDTRWAGGIVDRSWFTEERFARYRQPGNIKLPFWLTPNKVYQGAAWYQREVQIPKEWMGRRLLCALERVHWESRLWIDSTEVGKQNSLAAPHEYDLTAFLRPGVHTLTLCIDNRIKDIDIGRNAHSITDHTQTNWNGIIGDITLSALPPVTVEEVRIEPDIRSRQIRVTTIVAGLPPHAAAGFALTLRCLPVWDSKKTVGRPVMQKGRLVNGRAVVQSVVTLGADARLWDEFDPHLYVLEATVSTETKDSHVRREQFGLREWSVKGSRFHINNRPVFLRGTLDFCMFPQTGYPSMRMTDWERLLGRVQSYGMNHVRFHSWCPPEAAFRAADKMGLYLQIECGTWCALGDGTPVDRWLLGESDRIVRRYGNHPSFCMMAAGNEPSGKTMGKFLADFVVMWKQKDSRRSYTSAAGWPLLPESDYHSTMYPRIQVWGMGLNSIINREPPQTTFDFRDTIGTYDKPVVAHETGQWCAYPNLTEIGKYRGVLRAGNYEILREDLTEKGLMFLADDFLLASGKLQALCYKADIEAALRTPGMAGFQLLGLHDFPGQGTAPVGVIDFFSDDKGYITGDEFRRFCGPTVPLARMQHVVYTRHQAFRATLEVAHFGASPLRDVHPEWELRNAWNRVVRRGTLPKLTVSWGNVPVGDLAFPLADLPSPAKYRLVFRVGTAENDWEVWVYPEKVDEAGAAPVFIVRTLDSTALARLGEGKHVLLTLGRGRVAPDFGGNVALGFSSIFWNTAWTSGQAPHTLGILCNPSHPALADFPTEAHSNWQWWDLLDNADAMVLDHLSRSITPIVRVIDDWSTNRRLALLFEARVGKGRILVSSINLADSLERRPEARQLRHSLLRYMSGPAFRPETEVSLQDLRTLIRTE